MNSVNNLLISIMVMGLLVLVGCKKEDQVDEPKDNTTIETPNDNPQDNDTIAEQVKGQLSITVSDVTTSTANVAIVNTNTDEYYFFGYDTYANWVRLGYENNEQYAMTDDFQYWLSYYEQNKEDFANYNNVYSFDEAYLYKASVAGPIENLLPKTEYIAYAYYVSLNANDTVLYGLTTTRFTTAEATMSNITFKIEKLNSDSIRVTPSNDEPYFVAVVDEETFYSPLEQGGAGGNKQVAFDQEIAFQQMVGGYLGTSMKPLTGVQTINVAKMIFLDGIHHILVAGWNGEYRTTEEVTELVMNISSHVDYEHPTYIKARQTKKSNKRLRLK